MRWNNLLCGVLMGVIALSGCGKKETALERAEKAMERLKKIQACELASKTEIEGILGVSLADPDNKAAASSAVPMCSYASASENSKDFLSVTIMLFPSPNDDPKKAYDAFLNGESGISKQFPDAKIAPVDGFGLPSFWYEDVHQLYVFTSLAILNVSIMSPQQPDKATVEIHKKIAELALPRLPKK